MHMRSELIFGALTQVSNRYQLCQLASKATRKLHKPNTRLQDTTNEVLYRFRNANPGMNAPIEEPQAQTTPSTRASHATEANNSTVSVDQRRAA
jgi:hypothetical protein